MASRGSHPDQNRNSAKQNFRMRKWDKINKLQDSREGAMMSDGCVLPPVNICPLGDVERFGQWSKEKN